MKNKTIDERKQYINNNTLTKQINTKIYRTKYLWSKLTRVIYTIQCKNAKKNNKFLKALGQNNWQEKQAVC